MIDSDQPVTNYYPNLESTYMKLDSLDWKSEPSELINYDSILYGFVLSIDDKIIDLQSNPVFQMKMYAEKVNNSNKNVVSKTDIQINKYIKCGEVLKLETTSDNYYNLLYNFTCLDWKYDYKFYPNNSFTDYVKLDLFPCQNCDKSLLYSSKITVLFVSIDIQYDDKGLFINFRPIFNELSIKPEFTNTYKETYKNLYFFNRFFNVMRYMQIKSILKDIRMMKAVKDRIARNSTSMTDPYFSISASFDFNCIQRDVYQTKLMTNLGMLGNICFLLFFIGKIVFAFLKKDENTCYLMNETMYIIDPKEKEKIKLWEMNLKDNFKKQRDGIVLVKEDYHNYNEM
jgi:stress response protein YsnF